MKLLKAFAVAGLLACFVLAKGTSASDLAPAPRQAAFNQGSSFGFSSVELAENEVSLSWSKNFLGARLETKSDANASWTTLTDNIALKGDFFTITREISGPMAWFQLASRLNGDADVDGLPDSWETASFGSIAAQSALADFDGDGVLNIEEYKNGSDPTLRNDREIMGASSRETTIVITEIHYNPASGPEFIEVFNSDIIPWNLAGYQFQGGNGSNIYTFPAAPESVLEPGVYRAINVSGLDNGGQTIRLVSKSGAVLLEVSYDDEAPWPYGPDGFGPSLTLKNPSYGENDPRAWGASWENGGTPGAPEPATPDPFASIRINEFVANPPVGSDMIELFNRSNVEVDLAGCVLKDASGSSTLTGTIKIPARGFWLFDPAPFGLGADGEQISLWSPQGRLIDAIKFGPQKSGVSMGRYPDGADGWHEQKSITKGAANSGLRLPEIIINEIMFNSPWGENYEYIELKNTTDAAKSLSGLFLEGGISATLPAVSIPANGYFLVVKDFAAMQAAYGATIITANNTVQWTNGVLANNGERLILQNSAGERLDEVAYSPAWGKYSDGGGSSLELVDPHSDNRLADNWAGSDETAKAPWVTAQLTGERAHAFNNSAPKGISGGFQTTSSHVDFMLLGEGDVLIDDVSVTETGPGNRVTNPTFNTGAVNWEFRGTHDSSSRLASGGTDDGPCVKVHSTGRADNVYGKITGSLNPAIPLTGQATLSVKVRWLGGTPYFLMRLKENSLELAGNLLTSPPSIPKTLGTPLAQNSRYAANGNTGPVLLQVQHKPTLPTADQDVVVTAKITDPDGISSVVLKYRVDPSQTFTSVTMNDMGDFPNAGDSFARDGVYSAKIPKQASGKTVAFFVEATDNASPHVLRNYPATAPAAACLIRFGETPSAGAIPTYRIWTTQETMAAWSSREKQHNTPLDCTFVYNNRAIYNCGIMYGGSDYTVIWYDTPTGNLCTYNLAFPELDRFLGNDEASLEPPKYDSTMVTEKTAFWMAEQLGLPAASSRFIHVTINGLSEVNRPSAFGPSGRIYEDRNRVDKSFLNSWFPSGNESDGPLFRMEVWNEQKANEAWPMPYVSPTLGNFVADSGKRRARYRWTIMDRTRGADPHNVYDSALYPLVDAANATDGYISAIENEVDIEKWMTCFAFERCAGNDDAYGIYTGHNIYMFKPMGKKWLLVPWDLERGFGIPNDFSNVLLSPTDSLFSIISGTDPQWEPQVWRMYQTAQFQRAYWRAFRSAVDGPLAEAGARMDIYFNALAAQGIWPPGQVPNAVRASAKTWIADRRAYIAGQLSANDSAFEITSNAGQDFATSQSSFSLVGTAPFSVVRLTAGSPASNKAVTWDFLDSGAIKQKPGKWTINVDLAPGPNILTVKGYDKSDALIGTDTITITLQ